MDYNPMEAPPVNLTQGVDAGALGKQWSDFMADPGNRAALMQFGVSLMQPMGIGQTPMGHLGQAVGGAGEALDRRRAQERLDTEEARKARETDSRAELRTAQASAAETRAAMAGQNAANAEARLGLQQRNIELTQQNRAQALYQQEVGRIRTANANKSLMGQPQDPIPTYDEWLSKNPQLSALLRAQGGGASPVAGATAAPPAEAIALLRQRPELRNDFDAKYGAGAADRALGSE